MATQKNDADFCHLRVLLSPKARTNTLVGRHGEDIKIKVTAPPIEGAANEALIKFLAETLKLSTGKLSLVAGQTGRRKIVKIEGLIEAELWNRLNKFL